VFITLLGYDTDRPSSDVSGHIAGDPSFYSCSAFRYYLVFAIFTFTVFCFEVVAVTCSFSSFSYLSLLTRCNFPIDFAAWFCN